MHTEVQMGIQKHRQMGTQNKTSAQLISENENICSP